jgi:hypothetical protein
MVMLLAMSTARIPQVPASGTAKRTIMENAGSWPAKLMQNLSYLSSTWAD